MNAFDQDREESGPSRSQRRRDALDVLALAEKLVALSATQLREVPLDDTLLEHVKLAQKITAHIAHKRQVHFLAKLMRKQDDLEPIRLAVDKPLEVRRKETAELHLIERWRERLIEDGDDALSELIGSFPDLDRSRLRQLMRQAQIERRENRAPSAQRAIFQMLKPLFRSEPSPAAEADAGTDEDVTRQES
ncbi:MAG: DUF615 domain-containing protein [Rhodanobacteraceae bacterium]|nr:DUF615 domain-containing protein [Rhodanobacteraceae bacterium]